MKSETTPEPLPRPFCGGTMKRIVSWARSFSPARPYVEYHHPDQECFLRHERWYFTDCQEAIDSKITIWNRRAS